VLTLEDIALLREPKAQSAKLLCHRQGRRVLWAIEGESGWVGDCEEYVPDSTVLMLAREWFCVADFVEVKWKSFSAMPLLSRYRDHSMR